MKCTLVILIGLIFSLGSLQAEFGDTKWSFQTGDVVYSSPVVDSNGNLYFGSRDGNVYSLDANGGLRWTRATGDWVESSPALSGDESTIYIGSWDDSLYALDTANGNVRWTFETGSLIFGSPAVASNGSVIFGASDGFVYCLDSSGSKKWEYYHGGELDSSPAIDREGNVYIGTIDGAVLALSSSGVELWTTELDIVTDRDSRVASSPALSDDGMLYVGSGNYYVYAIDTFDGTVEWKYETLDKIDSSPVIGVDGSVIVCGYDGYVYSISPSGYLNWRNIIGDIFKCTPAIDALGRIYVGAYIGNGANSLSVFSPEGIELWSTVFTDYIDSSPTLAENGSLYVGSHDGVLHAIESGAALSAGVWSRFRRSDGARGSLEDYNSPLPGREKLINIALRGRVGTGENVIISGFVVKGNDSKNTLVRAVGPSLAEHFDKSEQHLLMEDPEIGLFKVVDGEFKQVDSNDDWGIEKQAVEEANQALGAGALIEDASDSALLKEIDEGVYTAIASGKNGEEGITLVEVFDGDSVDTGTKLVNVSMRGYVGTGAEILIAGFVIDGSESKRLLIRAVGKGLEASGVSGALQDTEMRLYRGSQMVALNDDWSSSPEVSEILSAGDSAGASVLSDTDGDSGMVVWLEPGAYTVWVLGKSGTTGIALAEIYDLND